MNHKLTPHIIVTTTFTPGPTPNTVRFCSTKKQTRKVRVTGWPIQHEPPDGLEVARVIGSPATGLSTSTKHFE